MDPIHRFGKLFIFVYLLVWFVGSLWMMAVLGSGTVQGKLLGMDVVQYHDYACFGFAGALGGALYGLRMFHEHYHDLTTQWIYWYLMRPVLCFGSAIITIVLFESGILLLQVGDSMAARISVAFLTGFGYGKFMEKIRALTTTFFNGNGGAGGNGNGNDGGNGDKPLP
ncbi:hypothetical protein GCM10008018_57050 [Paenibacillus marchantiophytorum]|uniref:Uncharacterized protein n=1 Tax=Paenibacillus marchantiophytorum TaxID=1619310 RepID=A0ABQ1F9L2_9BACL|nr:hypothetical protein [Paenibacillus marchantiophytorum]GGA03596.1 hypothetical protein GCM10008018_57050 [Paenibacillus marchantiophytorum]